MDTENTKKRNMSPKGFLHKTTTKAANSAEGFLAAHREWLLSGEIGVLTRPIFSHLAAGTILPTPALEQIKEVVFNFMIASEVAKGEDAMLKRAEAEAPANWTATLYDRNGNICTRKNDEGKILDIQEGFDLSQEADRWMDRKLFEGPPDSFGVIQHATMTNKHGEPLSVVVMRGDAIARVLKQPKGAACHKAKKTTPRLGFGVKASQDSCHFSRG